jgi:carbonic anhydrase
MSKVRDEVLAANETYAADFGDKAKLTMPPARGSVVLPSMDARLAPA